jgi:hypothetical protein
MQRAKLKMPSKICLCKVGRGSQEIIRCNMKSSIAHYLPDFCARHSTLFPNVQKQLSFLK